VLSQTRIAPRAARVTLAALIALVARDPTECGALSGARHHSQPAARLQRTDKKPVRCAESLAGQGITSFIRNLE
jgi:hypothetical protein